MEISKRLFCIATRAHNWLPNAVLIRRGFPSIDLQAFCQIRNCSLHETINDLLNWFVLAADHNTQMTIVDDNKSNDKSIGILFWLNFIGHM